MNDNKKAAPVLAHRNGPAVEKCNPAQFHRPQFTTQKGGNAMKVSDFLQHGAENAISAAALCSIAGTTPRGLRHAIALERAAGGEILYTPGGHGGYFLPSLDAEQAQRERMAFYCVMKARAVCTFKTLRPVARSLGIPAGQLAFDLTENEQPEKES